ncbi:MAG: hypothetical protein VB032_10180, partial [Burkholderiaceae bacterium]|nr:hypothetical protein [Burkholderiaceae bacterium]
MTAFHVLTRGSLLLAALALAAPTLAQSAASAQPAPAASQPAPASATKASAAQSLPPAPVDLRQRYPKDSIDSPEMADRAIKDVKQERAAIEARFKHEERMCYQNEFFANRCRNQAKERRRLALAETRSVQIEANQYKRHAAVDKRDEAMAKKNAGEPADQRKRAAEAQAHDKRMADQQKRSQKKQLAAESKQGKNEEVYAKKVKQAEERRR